MRRVVVVTAVAARVVGARAHGTPRDDDDVVGVGRGLGVGVGVGVRGRRARGDGGLGACGDVIGGVGVAFAMRGARCAARVRVARRSRARERGDGCRRRGRETRE